MGDTNNPLAAGWRHDRNEQGAQRTNDTKNDKGKQMMNKLRKLWLEDEGQDLAEYGLLLILIAVAVVTGITAFKDQIAAAFNSATSVLGS
jgi:pilus assembly protein Flp/PilA